MNDTRVVITERKDRFDAEFYQTGRYSTISGPGASATGSTPEEALANLHEKTQGDKFWRGAARKYEKNDIVIVETHDSFRGKVRVPAIISAVDEEHHAYEARVLFPLHEKVRTVFAFWTIGESEIAAWLGKAGIEK